MKLFTQSIKLKIVLAFGACVALTVAVVAFGQGLPKMNVVTSTAYSQDTVAIADLSDSHFSIRFPPSIAAESRFSKPRKDKDC